MGIALSMLSVTALADELLISPAPTLEETWLVSKVKTYDGRFQDDDAWCTDAIVTVYEAGLMEGKTPTRFDITSSLTNAQITVISARLHDLLNGGDGVLPSPAEGESWYQPAVDHLQAQCGDAHVRYLTARLDATANDPCTRLSFVHMLTGVLPDTLPPINDISAVPDSTDPKVLAFYQWGVLNGSDEYGTFYENEPLTRGAAAAILARIVDPDQRLASTLKSLDLCRDILGVEPDTVLLTLSGEPITAEIFAYACVNAGTLHQLAYSPLHSFGTEAPINYIKQLAAYELVANSLADDDPAGSISGLEQSELAEKAAEKAGLAGISQEGWQWIIRKETISNNIMIHYLLTYGEQSPREGENGYTMLARATSTAKERISIETTAALESLDWNAIYHRAIRSPCASDYQLSIW